MMHRTLALAATLAAAALVGGEALAKKPDGVGKPDKPGKPDRSSFGKARAPLVRPGGAPDENAKGRIDVMRRRNGSDLRVKGQRLDPNALVDIVILRLGDDPSTLDVAETDFVVATQTLADTVAANDDGCAQVRLRTRKGDALPFDVTSLDELAGHRIAIREESATDDGLDLLVGTVPLIGADLPRRVRERDDLVPVDDQVTCRGRVRLTFRGKDVRSEIRIDVKGLAEGDPVSFRMDDGTGQVVEVGSDIANAEGEARYRVRTHHGDVLSFGALTCLELRGRAIEVWVDPQPVDLTPEIPDDPLQESGLCLTGTLPGAD